MKAVSEGYSGFPSHELANCFEVLFPEVRQTNQSIEQTTQTYLKIPPVDQSHNVTILNGVPHCLVYGYDVCQVQEKPVLKRRRHSQEADEHRGRPQHRVIRRKRLDDRERSRSPSPDGDSSSDGETDLPGNVVYKGQSRPNQGSVAHILNNPNDYMLSASNYHKFFEPHKPDLLCLQTTEGQSGQRVAVAKFVCVISSWCREGKAGVSIERHVGEITERCVQACLAALACNQDSVLGICAVVDGLKVVKVRKSQDCNGHVSYNITETYLVVWDDLDEMYVLLEMIRKEIQE